MQKSDKPSLRTFTHDRQPRLVYTVLLFLGLCYGSKMYCSTDVNISQTLLKEEGMTEKQLSLLFASGYVFSLFGKMASGPIADNLGGRTLLVLSVIGSATPSMLLYFTPSGSFMFPCLFVLWNCVGFFALGSYRIGATALAANWVPIKYLGRFMSFIAMSPLLGDALVRLSLAPILQYGWRPVCLIAGLLCVGLSLPACMFVTNSPSEADYTIQYAKVVEDEAVAKKPKGEKQSYMDKLKPLLREPLLWILALLSGTLFGTRNLFMYYATNYLSAVLCNEADDVAACLIAPGTLKQASVASSLFPFLGAVATMLIGTMKDALPERHRGACVAPFVFVLCLGMVYLACVGTAVDYIVAVTIIGVGGALLFGPSKIINNAIAINVGGKELKGTTISFLGQADSLATITLMLVKGVLGDNWSQLFSVLTVLCFVSLLCAMAVWIEDLRAHREEELLSPLLADPLSPKSTSVKRRNHFKDSVATDRPS